MIWVGFDEKIGCNKDHQDGFFGQSPLLQRKETMKRFWNDAVLGWKGSFYNLPPEVLMPCNQAFIFENLFFFLISPLD
jgi:hypothetical protein